MRRDRARGRAASLEEGVPMTSAPSFSKHILNFVQDAVHTADSKRNVNLIWGLHRGWSAAGVCVGEG